MDTPQASMRNLARPSSAVEAASASVPVATHVLEAVRDCEALQIFLTRFDGAGESRMHGDVHLQSGLNPRREWPRRRRTRYAKCGVSRVSSLIAALSSPFDVEYGMKLSYTVIIVIVSNAAVSTMCWSQSAQSASSGTSTGATGDSNGGAAGPQGATAGGQGAAGSQGNNGVNGHQPGFGPQQGFVPQQGFGPMQQQGGQQQGGQQQGGEQPNWQEMGPPNQGNSVHRGHRNFNGITRRPFFSEPGIRRQLNLDDDQIKQLKEAHFQAFQHLNLVVQSLHSNLPEADRMQLMQQLGILFNMEFGQAVDGIIKDPQARANFEQVHRQYQGLNAFNDPAIKKQFNLTPEQGRQLRTLSNQWQNEMQRSQPSRAQDASVTTQQQGVERASFMNQLNSILKPDQQMAWTQLTGLAFDFQSQTFFPQNELDAGKEMLDSGPPMPGENLPSAPAEGAAQGAQSPGVESQDLANQSAQNQGAPSPGPQSAASATGAQVQTGNQNVPGR